jgi:hypothetical protein
MKRIMRVAAAVLGLGMSSAIAQDQTDSGAAEVFNWSGLYAGIHGGGGWHDTKLHDFDCNSITNLVGEGGGSPSFATADDIYDNGSWGPFDPDVIFNFGPYQVGPDFPGGCGTVEWSDGDPNTNNPIEVFNLDGDFIGNLDGVDGYDFSSSGDDHSWHFLGGGQVGVNAQYGRLVVGLEGDITSPAF